jgi:hypothetical protein
MRERSIEEEHIPSRSSGKTVLIPSKFLSVAFKEIAFSKREISLKISPL